MIEIDLKTVRKEMKDVNNCHRKVNPIRINRNSNVTYRVAIINYIIIIIRFEHVLSVINA